LTEITNRKPVIARLGNVLYWTGNCAAILLASLGGIGFIIALMNKAGEGMILSPILVVFAVFTWLFGRACLYVLAGR
jgi:hypothetical protein